MQDLAYIEFFAGVGNVYNAVRQKYTAVAMDITYMKDPPRNNPMDINSAAGFALLCSNIAMLVCVYIYCSVLSCSCILEACYLAGASRKRKWFLLPFGCGLRVLDNDQHGHFQEKHSFSRWGCLFSLRRRGQHDDIPASYMNCFTRSDYRLLL